MKLYIDKEDVLLCVNKAEEFAEHFWAELNLAGVDVNMLEGIAAALKILCESGAHCEAYNVLMAYKCIVWIEVYDLEVYEDDEVLQTIFMEIFLSSADSIINFIHNETAYVEDNDEDEELPFA